MSIIIIALIEQPAAAKSATSFRVDPIKVKMRFIDAFWKVVDLLVLFIFQTNLIFSDTEIVEFRMSDRDSDSSKEESPIDSEKDSEDEDDLQPNKSRSRSSSRSSPTRRQSQSRSSSRSPSRSKSRYSSLSSLDSQDHFSSSDSPAQIPVQASVAADTDDQHQMDPSITEWILKTGETKLSYTVDIPNCEEVIRKYRNGQCIQTKEFKISNSKFRLIIEPVPACDEEKDDEENNFVAIYLENMNNWRVKYKVQFKVQTRNFYRTRNDYKKTVGPSSLGSQAKDGARNFVPHAMIRKKPAKKNVLTKDGALELQADIELLGEEVNSSRENAINNDSELNNLIYSQHFFVKEEIEEVKNTIVSIVEGMVSESKKEIQGKIEESKKAIEGEIDQAREETDEIRKNINSRIEESRTEIQGGIEATRKEVIEAKKEIKEEIEMKSSGILDAVKNRSEVLKTQF